MDIQNELNKVKEQLQALESKLSDPEVLSDPEKIKTVNQEYSETKDIVEIGEKYEQTQKNLQSAKETLQETDDAELKELAQTEIEEAETELPALEEELTLALVPPDPLNKKNIIIEIRAGAGGGEAALFASELYRMYSRYAERKNWKTEIISKSQNDLGGFKEIVFSISGHQVYRDLKFESGVHRVQRVPETEKQGRVHTSTATVAVLPEAEEVDVKIDPKDLDIEATTSTGAGGQSVNTAYSAIRITHKPTGIMVYCQDERSQKQNKERALSIIRARVFAHEQEKQMKEREDARRGQIGSGDRSEKIRTYNFPQDRITDHRIKTNYHDIPAIMDGNLDELIHDLRKAELEQAMANL